MQFSTVFVNIFLKILRIFAFDNFFRCGGKKAKYKSGETAKKRGGLREKNQSSVRSPLVQFELLGSKLDPIEFRIRILDSTRVRSKGVGAHVLHKTTFQKTCNGTFLLKR